MLLVMWTVSFWLLDAESLGFCVHTQLSRCLLSESLPAVFHQVHELERTRRNLETEAQNLRVQTQELEEELAEVENSRLRLEVTLQALKAQFERELSASEEKGEEKRRALSKQVSRREEVLRWEEKVLQCPFLPND